MNLATCISILVLMCLAGSCSSFYTNTYYVSQSGNDSNDGLSPSNAWRTVSRINSRKIHAGDSVLFEAGGVWRETLLIDDSGRDNASIVFSRYGRGRNPCLYGSDSVFEWEATRYKNVWMTSRKFDNPRPFFPRLYPGSVFFEVGDDIIWGNYKVYDSDLSLLKNQFDWTWNKGKVYIYSVADPEYDYNSVEVNQRKYCVTAGKNKHPEHIEVNGINMFFSRLAGFSIIPVADKRSEDIIIRNSHIGYIGDHGSNYAYGIEASASDLIVEGCIINDCGRRGISFNLYDSQPVVLQKIYVRNNYFYNGNHTTSLDLAAMKKCIRSVISDVYFYNNIVDDSQVNFGESYHISNQIFIQEGGAYFNNIRIFNNLFIMATSRNILIEGADSVFIWNNSIIGHNPLIREHPYANVAFNHTLNVDYRNNLLYDNLPDKELDNQGVMMYYKTGKFIKKDYNLYFSLHPGKNRNFACHRINNLTMTEPGYWNTEEWMDYLHDNPEFEQHSPSPSDPLFEDEAGKNFMLREGSPACESGTTLNMVVFDLNGFPRDIRHPSIGAFEYGSEVYSSSAVHMLHVRDTVW